MKYLTVSELRVDDKVIPLSTDPREKNQVFIVTDLHPVLLSNPAEYKTVAVTLWEYVEDHYGPGHPHYGREHTSRTMLYSLVSRRWD